VNGYIVAQAHKIGQRIYRRWEENVSQYMGKGLKNLLIIYENS
jgi:hypothetical protein